MISAKNLESQKLKTLQKNFLDNKKQQIVGLSSSAIGFVIASLCTDGVIVAKDLVSSSKLAQMLDAFNFKSEILTSPYENSLGLTDQNLKFDFFNALGRFARGLTNFLIVLPEVLFQKVPSKNALTEKALLLNKNFTFDLSNFSKTLVEIGFERTDFISARGQFSIKGDTVILSPINSPDLVRIEFFDTQIEKITIIGAEDKKAKKTIDSFEVFPCDLKTENKNVLSFKNAVFFDEPKQIEEALNLFEGAENFIKKENIFKNLSQKQIAFSSIIAKTFFFPDEIMHFSIEMEKSYVFDLLDLVTDLNVYKNSGKRVTVFCGNEKNKKFLTEFLKNNNVFTQKINGENTEIVLTEEFLPASIILSDAKNVLLGTNNIFKKQKTTLSKKSKKVLIPKINDFVVHEKHGVGRCIGIEKLTFSGFSKDYIIIEYAGGDKFYLPSEQADSLSEFSGKDEPKLNKLGGQDFARVKEKVFKSIKEMAFDLLKLYAKREKAKGTVYCKDDYLMEQFENAFPFEETPDQLRAIQDIKADMESTKIMDRLVCGDVGFGKTEVALRAIYKAVISGSQVAFLCPTTILAEQHFKTCQKRFSGFMVKCARFNRLITKKEEHEVLKGLEDGTVNVVCGTHKLLSKNVKFKNLTLLVLDEEHKFGVEDKEKIKNIKNNIDVLSLSATPIPRTLHMSLSGIRDISTIDTPPKARKPVQTFITEYDDELIKNAIKKELSRGGQVLVIYNRIDSIYLFKEHLASLVPNANIGVAHGRLTGKALEDSIMKLYSGEYNILVSTTLIENGIDLPSANTLLVMDADKLGLAEAYQIRGRIGRSDKTAFAYFLLKPEKQISQNAYKRLQALMENTALGSGLKIAMADLDIRGAGNVLGKEQSGNMVKVGYDLYYKLLNIALKQIKGEDKQENREVKLDIALDAFIPEHYIESEDERLKTITEISELENKTEKKSLTDNLSLLYGKVPEEVDNLCSISILKNKAEKCGVKRILINDKEFKIYFYEKKDIILDKPMSVKEGVKLALSIITD